MAVLLGVGVGAMLKKEFDDVDRHFGIHGGDMKRGPTLIAMSIGIGAVLEDELAYIFPFKQNRKIKNGAMIGVSDVDIGTVSKKEFNDMEIAVFGSVVKRSAAFNSATKAIIVEIGIGAVLQEKFASIEIAITDSNVKRCAATVISEVGIGTKFKNIVEKGKVSSFVASFDGLKNEVRKSVESFFEGFAWSFSLASGLARRGVLGDRSLDRERHVYFLVLCVVCYVCRRKAI